MSLHTRPPVITIMGHVDHGKTTLLDFIRKSNIVSREEGGITQHIGAYQIEFQGKKLTFIDTPGHAAFSKMRERGAKVTDIIILVVAANDGVKPQTIESIRHIKTSGASVIVALNKTDLPDVHPEIAKSQLAEQGLMITEFGGDVELIEISAKTGKGVDKLLENLVAMADLLELKADPTAPLQAVVIESTKDAKKGSVASVIVQQGTLKLRQDIFTDEVSGRVRALFDENGKALVEVLPGCPAEIIGLKEVPAVGSVIGDAKTQNVESGKSSIDSTVLDQFADLDFAAAFGDKEKINLIVKADVEGTLEVIRENLDTETVNLISSGVGPITETDLESAITGKAGIIAFRVSVSSKIKQMAKQSRVVIRKYDVIYKLIEDLQKQILKLMDATIDEAVTGEAEIIQVFAMKGGMIAGVRVKTGEIKKTDKLHLKRGENIMTDLSIASMMHGKVEIEVVKDKNEAGITFKQKKIDFQAGDVLVAYKIEE